MVQYPAALRDQAAAEIEALPPGAALDVFMADYHVLRRQAAACAGRD